MVQGLSAEEKREVLGTLEALEHAESMEHDAGEDHNKDDQALFVVHTLYDYSSPEELALAKRIVDGAVAGKAYKPADIAQLFGMETA